MESLNKLVLGTVQFGLDYGINNFAGKPSKEESLKMLSFAYENGIKIFDTAYAYGNAEEILGEFCKKRNFFGEIKIITKIKNLSEFDGSLAKLEMDYVDGCLLHDPEDIKNKTIINSLKKIKDSGLAKNIGVSVYDPKDAIFSANIKEIDYIQIPYSIFDQRLDKTDFFELAEKNNKKVFARSVFLQGLLIMPELEIPEYIKDAKPYLAKLDKIVRKYRLSKKQAALHFVLENKNINYAVFGAENIDQIKEIIDISSQKIDFSECKKELEDEFKEVPKYIISPNLWQKR